MKRALSLIIVLAMVLCMIPFSAFAADADFGFGGDLLDTTEVTLDSTNNYGLQFKWTATEEGDVSFNIANPEDAPEDFNLGDYTISIVLDSDPNGEYTLGDLIHVQKDDVVGFVVYEDNFTDCTFNLYPTFVGLPGTETNPYEIWNPAVEGEEGIEFPENNSTTTIAIQPNDSVFYILRYYTGHEVTFTGAGVMVSLLNQTIEGTVDGFVTVPFGTDSEYKDVLVKFTNKSDAAATYEVTAVLPNNYFSPQVVTDGTYNAKLTAGDDGYFYSYTAAGDGIVKIFVSAADAEGNAIGWMYQATNVTKGAQDDLRFSDDEIVVNPAEIAVSAGDVVELMVNTYNPADMWGNPAGTITTTFELVAGEEPPVEPTTIVIEALPYEVTHSGVYEQAYTYTATEAGYLYVASEGWVDMNVGDVWAEGYGDGYVLAMNAGDVANINVYAYWGEESFTYKFSWMTEITPDGSYGFPFVANIPSDGTVVTLENAGEDAVYYVYTATEDCKIYDAFMETTTDVEAGESLVIYVAPGGIQVNYVLPVAVYGGVNYYDLQEAISAAAAVATDTNKQTVKMNTSYVNENQTLILEPNVILDTAGLSITVKYLIGLSGSSLQCSANRFSGANYATAGKINVAKNNMILSEITADSPSGSQMKIMPFWVNETYVLGNLRVYDNTISATFENDGVFLSGFYHLGGSKLNDILLDNGSADHGFRVVIRTEWMTDTGAYANDYTYLDSFVKQVATGTKVYTYTLNGLVEALKVDMSTFEITPMIITDCGAVYYGNTIEYSAE